MPTWAAGALVVCAALCGCTTTVGGTATPAGSGSASSPARATERQAPAVPDAAALTAAALQLSDLPSGWSDGDGSAPDEEIVRSVSRCLGAPIAWTDVAQVGHASAFVDAGGDQVGSFTAAYHSQQDVDGDAALLRDSRAPGCLGRAFDAEAPQTSTPGGATVGAADFTVVVGNGGGPANVAGTGIGTVPVTTASGQVARVYIEFVLITGRLTEGQLFFLSTGEPLPEDLRAGATAAVAQRLAAL